VGLARALEIIGFDNPIPSDQTLAWGLATKVDPDGEAMGETHKIAHELTKSSLHSFGWCKELVTDSFQTAFKAQIETRLFILSYCADDLDGKEGLKAFTEKRKPVFNKTN
jgi:2-(1,2-epoxy-1,2-dihydrophenyl)acetyl-CoA isomerase